MSLDIPAVQRALAHAELDGWLLYDFHGSNPVASKLAGLHAGTMATRRWYYMVPRAGDPQALVHAIERHNLDALPGAKHVYAGRAQLAAGLSQLIGSARRIAMEYSPEGNIPYIGRVDAGTIEFIRSLGVEVVSSGDLIQRFEACWSEDAIATHRAASERLYRIKDRAFAAIADRVSSGTGTSEYDVQQLMVRWFEEEGLVSSDAPVVAVDANAGNPHYQPQLAGSASIGRDQLVLLDLWGKLPQAGAVYADITWVGYTGSMVPESPSRAFAAIARGRDTAVRLIQDAAATGSDLRGFQVDRAVRTVLQDAGYGDAILHRTGHSLGEEVHGNGVHMDDYETHDDRRLLPGSGFTIEPGLYFDTFGVRTEVNMVFGRGEATVTGPVQDRIVTLA